MNILRVVRRVASMTPIAAWSASVCAAMAAGALAKPPLQLAEAGIRVEPLAIAPARIENGKFIFGEWQEYQPIQTRGAKGYYYVFDCFGGWVDPELGQRGYVNYAHGGLGAAPGEPRVPWSTGTDLGSSRWYFGASFVCPLVVDDIRELAQGVRGGAPIDAIDAGWYWGGGECLLAFATTDDSGLCSGGNPFEHAYSEIVVINVGPLEAGGYYYVNAEGIWSQLGLCLPTPHPGGSYLAALLTPSGQLNTEPGTQFMIWGTGDACWEPYRAGIQDIEAWLDAFPTDGVFSENECYELTKDYPGDLGLMVGFASLRCPADLTADGFVNADDFDLFAQWFSEGWTWYQRLRADLNADGFVNGNDYDAFASWFDEGC